VAELHVLPVFTAEDGGDGNPLGVFLDGDQVPAAARQRVATELGFSETVFVDDRRSGAIRIFTPAAEIGFAGHPTVGTAWLLEREGQALEALRPPAGTVGVRRKGELTFIAARPEWAPPIDYLEVGSPAEVEAADPAIGEGGFPYLWAWIDEAAAEVRSRSFPGAWGIAEDEATGAAAIGLCARLGRPLTIHQGRGSLLHARPLEDGTVEVGGRVVLDERREHPL
jgi:predicted PhzF superfamily epimerase YddE/YHI9